MSANTAPVPPEKLARRTRILTPFFAVVFAAVGVAFTGFGLASPPMLAAGLTEIALSVLLVVAVFVASPVVRWIALAVAMVGAATAMVLQVTMSPGDLGIAATTLLGIFAMLGLTWFILHSSARAAHPARS
ncbi:hypothetical protein MTES_1599 [Microbacterium testaceum StLB037]|uniref:Uncharacterized protein n=1 Tax=Microbacterium testaceum (strain StLB037) TaxID=979556 RepID=E8N9U4_MICTS|nr:hypothetical protein [Microbacterium testaceum]BAJ74563.1 hypothetical protein MTES_1599 [Microbacterium testaceum StLB037]